MRMDSTIFSGQARMLSAYYEVAWPEIFDVMTELDRPYSTREIADRMECFAHLAPHTRLLYTKAVLQRLANATAEARNFHLLQHHGKWIAPSKGSRWFKIVGVHPTDD